MTRKELEEQILAMGERIKSLEAKEPAEDVLSVEELLEIKLLARATAGGNMEALRARNERERRRLGC